MSLTSEGVPLTMPVAPAGSAYNNGGNGMFGGDGAWWIVLFLIFAAFGWGGNGFGGGFGGNNSGALTRGELCQDMNFSQLENGVRGIQQGICDSTFALNNAITGGFNTLGMSTMQGFNSVNQGICNLGYNVQNGFNSTQVAMMQGNNALQSQLAQCCCDNRVGQMQIQNQMASDTCAVTTAIANSTRDTLENANSNTRAILDSLTAMKIEAKDQRIAEQAAQIQALQLSASQANQNAVLMAAMDANKADILRRTGAECPTPAYIVQPPQPVSFATNCSGQAILSNGWCNNSGCCGCN